MADVGHELSALRFVVDAPLSSKVAQFNKKVNDHQQGQQENPFSGSGDMKIKNPNLKSLAPDEYGKPKAGSLTEYRGMKANIEVYKEMVDLCAIIHQNGKPVKGHPELRQILFGELFQIYVHINDKVLGLLLRARKHELLTFEGEVLFQKFHDHVPIFLLRPFKEIREIMTAKQEEIRQNLNPNPKRK